MDSPGYLYRGTTVGWPGNPVLQQLALTPTTTNPLVATLFAVECSRFGKAIVYLARQAECEGLFGPKNVLAAVEFEIVLKVSPSKFAESHAAAHIEAKRAQSILVNMGYHVPATISSHDRLQKELMAARAMVLNPEHLRAFNAQALAQVSKEKLP